MPSESGRRVGPQRARARTHRVRDFCSLKVIEKPPQRAPDVVVGYQYRTEHAARGEKSLSKDSNTEPETPSLAQQIYAYKVQDEDGDEIREYYPGRRFDYANEPESVSANDSVWEGRSAPSAGTRSTTLTTRSALELLANAGRLPSYRASSRAQQGDRRGRILGRVCRGRLFDPRGPRGSDSLAQTPASEISSWPVSRSVVDDTHLRTTHEGFDTEQYSPVEIPFLGIRICLRQ